MKFEDGMVGVIIVSLALSGALIGSYLAGIEPEENEVVRFNYLADVSGLFDYDRSPQFIEFDPSSNYTGYFSEDSKKPTGPGYYFTSDQVGYTPSINSNTGGPRVNNYRLDLEPTNYTSSTITPTIPANPPSGSVLTNPFIDLVTSRILTANPDNVMEAHISNTGGTTVSLSLFIQSLEAASGVDTYWLRSSDNIDSIGQVQNTPAHIDVDWIVFTLKSRWGSSLTYPNVTTLYTPAYNEAFNTNLPTPYLSAQVNTNNGTVILYSDNGFLNTVGTYSISDVYVSYGGTSTSNYSVNFGSSVETEAWTSQSATYLDPNFGVYMKD